MKNEKDILAQAIDQLKDLQIPAGPPQQLVDDTLGSINDGMSEQNIQQNKRHNRQQQPAVIRLYQFGRIAAVIALLVLAGFTAGRVSAPKPKTLNAEQIYAQLKPVIQKDMLEQVQSYCQKTVAQSVTQSSIQLKDVLSQQFRQELNDYAIRTLAASQASTNKLMQQYTAAVLDVQKRDRTRLAAVIYKMERDRRQNDSALAQGLKTVAYRTQDSIDRTKKDVMTLLTKSVPVYKLDPNAVSEPAFERNQK